MPWTPETFRAKHNKALTNEEAARACATANAVLKATGDEGRAIRAGNAAAHKHTHGKKRFGRKMD